MFLLGIFAILGFIAYKGIEVSEENANNKAMGGGAAKPNLWVDPSTGLPAKTDNPPGWPTTGPSASECEAIMASMPKDAVQKLLVGAFKATDAEWNAIKLTMIKGGGVKQAQCLDSARQSMRYMIDNGLVPADAFKLPPTLTKDAAKEYVANAPPSFSQSSGYGPSF